jgi:hypothetical protein
MTAFIIKEHKVIISLNNIHIEDSYQIKDIFGMLSFLELIQEQTDGSTTIFKKRSYGSLICEWRVHNLLYDLHLFRSHTKDVDLNNIKWYYNLIYIILSPLYFH